MKLQVTQKNLSLPGRKKRQTDLFPKTKSRPNKMKRLAMVTSPSIIVVGDSLRVNEVCSELKSLDFTIKKASFIKDIKEMANGSELGIIYVSPLKRSEILSVHKNLRKQAKFKGLPFFAVVPNWVSARKERQMYKEGVRMIFEWPKEKKAFRHLISTSLLTGLRKVKSDDPDTSLDRAIENRMRGEFGHFSPNFQTFVYNGIVMLRGEVNSAAKKRSLVGKIKKIPGVRGVVDASLEVIQKKMNPDSLKRTADKLLKNSKGIQERTLDVLIRPADQKLILTGTASEKRRIDQAKGILENLHGVKKVESRVIISPTIHKKDIALTKRAQRVVRKLNVNKPTTPITVKVASGVALLRGRARNVIEAKHLAKLVKSLDGIVRVKNQLSIPRPANY